MLKNFKYNNNFQSFCSREIALQFALFTADRLQNSRLWDWELLWVYIISYWFRWEILTGWLIATPSLLSSHPHTKIRQRLKLDSPTEIKQLISMWLFPYGLWTAVFTTRSFFLAKVIIRTIMRKLVLIFEIFSLFSKKNMTERWIVNNPCQIVSYYMLNQRMYHLVIILMDLFL